MVVERKGKERIKMSSEEDNMTVDTMDLIWDYMAERIGQGGKGKMVYVRRKGGDAPRKNENMEKKLMRNGFKVGFGRTGGEHKGGNGQEVTNRKIK